MNGKAATAVELLKKTAREWGEQRKACASGRCPGAGSRGCGQHCEDSEECAQAAKIDCAALKTARRTLGWPGQWVRGRGSAPPAAVALRAFVDAAADIINELEHAASALNGAAAEDDTVPSLRMCYTVDTLDGLSSTERHRWEHEQGNGVGYITKQMLERSMPPPGPDTLILLCGPKPMVKHACLPALAALGYDRARCFVY